MTVSLLKKVGIAAAVSLDAGVDRGFAASASPSPPFAIELPAGCTMTAQPGPDFEVWYVTCGGRTYAGVYVGNAANTSMPRSRLIRTGRDFPGQIQVWSLVVPDDQAKADRIAASVKVAGEAR